MLRKLLERFMGWVDVFIGYDELAALDDDSWMED